MLIPALGFYGWLAWQTYINWDSELIASIQIRPEGLVLATVIQAIGYFAMVGLWATLVGWLSKPLHYLEHLKIYAYSGLAAKLPGWFWGVATRILLYERVGVSKSVIGLAAGVETAGMAIAATFIVILSQVLRADEPALVSQPVLIGILIILGTLTHPRILRKLLSRLPNVALLQALDNLAWHRMVALVAGHGVILVMGGVCLFGVTSAVVGAQPNLVVICIQVWALTTLWSILLIWLPGDFGLRNSPFVLIFARFLPIPIVTILLAVWRLWVSVMELVWGAVGFGVTAWIERTRKRSRLETHPESVRRLDGHRLDDQPSP
jgi:hypothetical protein